MSICQPPGIPRFVGVRPAGSERVCVTNANASSDFVIPLTGGVVIGANKGLSSANLNTDPSLNVYPLG